MLKGSDCFYEEWAPFYCSHVLQLPLVQLLWLCSAGDPDFLTPLLYFHFTFH